MIKLEVDVENKKGCTIQINYKKFISSAFAGETLAAIDKLCACLESEILEREDKDHVMVFYMTLLEILNERVQKIQDEEDNDIKELKTDIKNVARKAVTRDGIRDEKPKVSVHAIALSGLSEEQKEDLLNDIVKLLKNLRK